MKESTNQRNRRERPVCRSGSVPNITRVDGRYHLSICHSDRSDSGVEESTTLEKEPTQDKACCLGRALDSHSLPRDDMSIGDTIHPHRLYSERGGRQIAAPTDTPVGDTIHPHGLFSGRFRNGTQAVPYGFADWFIFLPNVFRK